MILSPVRKVLVVDDDELFCELVAKSLEKLGGYHVAQAFDGITALELLAEESFDLLLTDAVMPHMDGVTLILRVSQLYPKLPVILMTGYAQERQKAFNLHHLIDQVIEKPFDMHHICQVTQQLFEEITANKPTNDNHDAT